MEEQIELLQPRLADIKTDVADERLGPHSVRRQCLLPMTT
jgi:hypothetical protein